MPNRFIVNRICFAVVIIVFSIVATSGFSQDLSTWSKKELSIATTTLNDNFHSTEEKEVIFYINLARINPNKFLETIASPYFANEENHSNTAKSYFNTLKKHLQKGEKLSPLMPDEDLFKIAKTHAITMGKSGKVGHNNYENRVKKIKPNYSGLGETCDYGFENPLTIVMRLLIDDGVPSLGHREAILEPRFEHIGTSIQPHAKWNYNCVSEFGGRKEKN